MAYLVVYSKGMS